MFIKAKSVFIMINTSPQFNKLCYLWEKSLQDIIFWLGGQISLFRFVIALKCVILTTSCIDTVFCTVYSVQGIFDRNFKIAVFGDFGYQNPNITTNHQVPSTPLKGVHYTLLHSCVNIEKVKEQWKSCFKLFFFIIF